MADVHRTPLVLPRLYAILDIDVAASRSLDPASVFEAWLDAGVRLVQLRAKNLDAGPFLALARTLAARARSMQATFIVNDRADIARLSQASGLHVGQDDLEPAAVRGLLPSPAILGLSTHNDSQIDAALAEPVDYIALGPIYETRSKMRPDPVVGIEGIRRVRERIGKIPLVAIGGISLETAPDVIAAGASSVAVISDLMHADAGTRARLFLAALDRPASR